MLKSALFAGALLVAFAAPGYAETYTCDEATMTKWKTSMEAMTDKEKQAGYMKSYDTAMEAMKANKMDDCNKALNETMSSMGKDSQGSASGTTN
jgi:hypothetical protein